MLKWRLPPCPWISNCFPKWNCIILIMRTNAKNHKTIKKFKIKNHFTHLNSSSIWNSSSPDSPKTVLHINLHSLIQTILHHLRWVENSARHNPPSSQDKKSYPWWVRLHNSISLHKVKRKHSPHQAVNYPPKLGILDILHSQCNPGVFSKCLERWTMDSGIEDMLLPREVMHCLEPGGKPCPCPSLKTYPFSIVQSRCVYQKLCMDPMTCTRPKHIIQPACFKNKDLQYS